MAIVPHFYSDEPQLTTIADTDVLSIEHDGGYYYAEKSDFLSEHEDRLDTLEDDIATLETTVDTNRLYSDSQYLELKAKADSLQVKCNTLQAEVYTDDPILQYGAVEIIGDGYESDDTPIDVSANVVDGKLSMEQKGLTITNLVSNGDFSSAIGLPWIPSGGITRSDEQKVFGTHSMKAFASASVTYATYNFSATLGDKIYVSMWVYKHSGTGFISVIYPFNTVTPLQAALLNTGEFDALDVGWHHVDAIVTSPANGINVLIGRATAQTFQAYVDGFALYNLTNLGLDHITDTDILADLLPYVDGTKAVGKMGVRVVGRNLFDKSKVAMGFYVNGVHGNLTASATNTASEYTRISPDIAYYLYNNSYGISSSYYNKDKVFISSQTKLGALTIPANAYYIRFTIPVAYLDTAYLITGTSALSPYVPYQEQLTFLPAIGNSLPNGVADSIRTVQ